MGESAGSEGSHPPAGRGPRRRVSVRLLLLLVALVPTVGMLTLAVSTAYARNAERDAARTLDADAARLVQLIHARTAAAGEEVASSVLAIGADLGVDATELSDLYDQDFVARLTEARAEVDADPLLGGLPELARPLAALRGLRAGIDAGQVPFVELHRVSRDLTTAIDEVWQRRFVARTNHPDADELPARAQLRLGALYVAFLALASGADRAAITELVLVGDPTPADLMRLVEASGGFDAAVDMFPPRLGPTARAAWDAHLDRPAAQRFEAVLDDALASVLSRTESPLSMDISAFGDAYIDGPAWARGLTDLVLAAATDLHGLAAEDADDAGRDLLVQVVATVLLAGLSLVIALLVAREVARPANRLEAAAHQIHEGRFDLDPLPVEGPRELADTASAFNDMASTLAAVEAHAVSLAADPEAPILSERLPGRTGRALQVALNRLRSSMQAAESHRRALEQAASHDSLTGLANRSAALEVMARNLSLADREGGTVMALFIDLDGLKAINDRYGHATGDDALRLAADALRAATRAADIVARFGGDEFVVSGIAHDLPAEVEAVANRVRQAVGGQRLSTPDGYVGLGCSIGMATARRGSTAASLIDDADSALYLAKRRGRDQAAWFEPPDEPAPSDDPRDEPAAADESARPAEHAPRVDPLT
jgi:diguanylate cyclase (GGDEF)-like protein